MNWHTNKNADKFQALKEKKPVEKKEEEIDIQKILLENDLARGETAQANVMSDPMEGFDIEQSNEQIYRSIKERIPLINSMPKE